MLLPARVSSISARRCPGVSASSPQTSWCRAARRSVHRSGTVYRQPSGRRPGRGGRNRSFTSKVRSGPAVAANKLPAASAAPPPAVALSVGAPSEVTRPGLLESGRQCCRWHSVVRTRDCLRLSALPVSIRTWRHARSPVPEPTRPVRRPCRHQPRNGQVG